MVNQACRMYKAGCTHTGSVAGQSCYWPTPNVKPSKAGLECTHLPKHNANKDERDACFAHRYDKTQCDVRSSDCVYNAWRPTYVKEAESACNCGANDNDLQLRTLITQSDGANQGQVYTAEACDRACYTDPICATFTLTDDTSPLGQGRCVLYKPGCVRTAGVAAGQACYTPSVHVKAGKDVLTCTHRPEWNAQRDNRAKCVGKDQPGCLKQEAELNGQPVAACQWIQSVHLIRAGWACSSDSAAFSIGAPITGQSPESCNAACAADPRCTWFDFGHDRTDAQGGAISSSAAQCRLKRFGCPGAANVHFDAYHPSTYYLPATVPGTCSHQGIDGTDAAQVSRCAKQEKASCPTTGCSRQKLLGSACGSVETAK